MVGRTEAPLSQRAQGFPPSSIRGLEACAQEAVSQGIEIFSLNIGAPDTETALAVRAAGARFLLESSAILYGPTRGDRKLISAVIKFYERSLGIESLTSENILITQGASEALKLAIFSAANPGDVILTPDPGYSNYGAIAYEYGVKMQPIPTSIENGFHLIQRNEFPEEAIDRISRLVTPKTKAVIWSSPGNPTGTVYTQPELEVLKQVASINGLWLISDEVYRLLVFNCGKRAGDLLRAPSIFDVLSQSERRNAMVLDSASKMLGFCGGRVGILIVGKDVAGYMLRNASSRGCASTVGQAAVAAINEVEPTYFEKVREEFRIRRDLLHAGLMEMSDIGVKVSPAPPEGAFYIVADLGPGIVAAKFCEWLLTDYPQLSGKKQTLFLAPMRIGDAGFYLQKGVGESQVRIAYVLKKDKLQQALEILKEAIPLYRQSVIPSLE